MHPTAARLYEAAKVLGELSGQSAVARALGELPQTLNNWESRGVSAPGSLKAQAVFGCDANWLLTGDGAPPMRPGHGLDREEFAFIRRADVAFANGAGKIAYHEDDKPPLVFRHDFLRKLGVAEGNAVVVDASGSSNLPRIPEGAVVLVNQGDTDRLDGDFFAFRVGEDLLIKRLQKLEGIGILATAENPDFRPKQRVYPEGEDIQVIGRAVWFGSRL